MFQPQMATQIYLHLFKHNTENSRHADVLVSAAESHFINKKKINGKWSWYGMCNTENM